MRLDALKNKFGDIATCQTVDLLDSSAIKTALTQTLSSGPVYGFIHAAAAPLVFSAVSSAENHDQLKLHWAVGVAAFNQIAHGVTVSMHDGGVIVAVLSQAMLDVPPPKLSAYVSAKLATWGLVRAYAAELGPKGVRCNAVSPGMMDTPYTREMPVRVKQVEAASNPSRRLCRPEDVADAILYLASSRAGFVNGVNLPVTGGARMP